MIRLTTNKGFSLIELMIVLAIMAVMSAIAVAQYQSYSVNAKISQGMVILNNIGEMSKAYYDTHGVFPNLQQLGLFYDPADPTQSPMANTLSDYIANYIPYTFLFDQGNAYTCPSASYGGYISNVTPGDYVTVSQTGSLIVVNQLLVYINKTYQIYCQYYFYQYDPNTQITTPISGNFIPSCENGIDDPNADNFFLNAGNQC